MDESAEEAQSTPHRRDGGTGHRRRGYSGVGIRLADPAQQRLADWWLDLAVQEVERTVPKAVEYGANDLLEIGRQLAQTAGGMGLLGDDAPPDAPARLAELGVYFYLVGKFARWTSAIHEGRRISDDTLFDVGVYVRMAQRIRAVGSWPGTGPAADEEPEWPPDPRGMTVLGQDLSPHWILGAGPDGYRLGRYDQERAAWTQMWEINPPGMQPEIETDGWWYDGAQRPPVPAQGWTVERPVESVPQQWILTDATGRYHQGAYNVNGTPGWYRVWPIDRPAAEGTQP